MRGPLYSLWRSVPAIFIHGNIPNHHQKDKISLPSKMHLDRCLSLVRPTPPCRLWPLSFSGTLLGGPWCWYVGAGASLVGLVWFVGLFCMCYAGRDLLRLCLRILRVFLLIPDLCSWKHKSSKTTVELGYWYKYASKRYGFPSFMSIVDGHISHLTTINTPPI